MPNKRVVFDAEIMFSTNKLWRSHCVVPREDATYFLSLSVKRLVCTMNEKDTFQTALTPIGNETWVVKINQALLKKNKLDIGDKVHLSLVEDTSEFGLPMSQEFTELLAQDEEGKILFEKLTMGKKRTLIYIVSQKKTSDKRLETAMKILAHLKENNGKINYKLLYI